MKKELSKLELRSSIKGLEKSAEVKRRDNLLLDKEYAQLLKKKNDIEAEIENLKSGLRAKENMLRSKEDMLSIRSDRVALREEEINNTMRELDKRKTALDEEETKLNREKTLFRKETQEANTQIENKEKSVGNSLKQIQIETDKLLKRTQVLEEKSSEIENKINDLDKAEEALKKKKNEYEDLISYNGGLKKRLELQIEKVSAESERLQSELRKLTDRDMIIASKEKDIEEEYIRLYALENRVNRKIEVNNLQKELGIEQKPTN